MANGAMVRWLRASAIDPFFLLLHTGHFVSFALVFVAVYCEESNGKKGKEDRENEKARLETGEWMWMWMYVILFSPPELIHSPSSNEFALPHSFVSYCTFRSRLTESKFDGRRKEQTVRLREE